MRLNTPRPLGTIAALLLVAGLIAAGVVAAPPATRVLAETALLGTGHGLDHVVIAVRDLDYVTRVYESVLGFTPVQRGSGAGGIRHNIIPFGSTYLELITVLPGGSAASKDASQLAGFLARREGARVVGLEVSSAAKTAAFLRSRGLPVSGPQEAANTSAGSLQVRAALWRTVGFTKPVVPADAIFFIEYSPGLVRAGVPRHANTSTGIHAVWMAVKNLPAAENAYDSVGLPAGRTLAAPRVAATGREVPVGQGVILLLGSTDSHGLLASSLAEHGEGILGMSIEVSDLEATQTLVENSTEQVFHSYDGPYGESILIPPALTYGVWMEFFQKR